MVVLVIKAVVAVVAVSAISLYGSQFVVRRRYPGTSGGIGMFYLYVFATLALTVAVPIAVVTTGHFWPFVGGAAALLALGSLVVSS